MHRNGTTFSRRTPSRAAEAIRNGDAEHGKHRCSWVKLAPGQPGGVTDLHTYGVGTAPELGVSLGRSEHIFICAVLFWYVIQPCTCGAMYAKPMSLGLAGWDAEVGVGVGKYWGQLVNGKRAAAEGDITDALIVEARRIALEGSWDAAAAHAPYGVLQLVPACMMGALHPITEPGA